MNRVRFLRQRQGEWAAFEKLLVQLRQTRRSKWSSDSLGDLSRMYRSICYDLSLVRSREWGDQLEKYLNDLVARGHNFLYRAPPGNLWAVVEFVVFGFPVLLRKRKGFFLASLALFGIPFVVAMVATLIEPDVGRYLLPGETRDSLEQMYATPDIGEEGGDFATGRSLMASFYVFNNVGIAFRLFALGAFFGIGTIHQLLFNGLTLGAATGHVIGVGHGANFCSFVISHGSFELTALVVAGASGLLLGWGLIYRGGMSAGESLRTHAREAIQLIAGAGVMLGVAALIEGFFSPLPIPHFIKYAVGGLLWIVVIGWLLLARSPGSETR